MKTGPLDKAFAEMDKCANQLIEEWGLDVAEQNSLQSRPEPKNSPGNWARSSDYPESALASGGQALINFMLLIDSNGTPVKCIVQRGTAAKSFRDRSCELLLRRARFDPAINAEGRPVSSYYLNKIRWIIPY